MLILQSRWWAAIATVASLLGNVPASAQMCFGEYQSASPAPSDPEEQRFILPQAEIGSTAGTEENARLPALQLPVDASGNAQASNANATDTKPP